MSAETDIRNGFSLDKNGVYIYIYKYILYILFLLFFRKCNGPFHFPGVIYD